MAAWGRSKPLGELLQDNNTAQLGTRPSRAAHLPHGCEPGSRQAAAGACPPTSGGAVGLGAGARRPHTKTSRPCRLHGRTFLSCIWLARIQ